MKRFLWAFIVFFWASLIFVPRGVQAQEATPSATPLPTSGQATTTPTPTVSTTPTNTPVPTASPTPTSQSSTSTPTPTPTTTAVGGVDDKTKKEVLGKASVLGSTSSGEDTVKWIVGGVIGFVMLFVGLGLTRIRVEE